MGVKNFHINSVKLLYISTAESDLIGANRDPSLKVIAAIKETTPFSFSVRCGALDQ